MAREVDPAVAPALDAALPPFDDALCLEGAATQASFALAGRRAVVVGHEDRGIDEIRVHPLRVISGLRHESAPAHAVKVTPIGVERRIRTATGDDVVERIFVPRDFPAAILEWHAPAGAELSLTWRVDLRHVEGAPETASGPERGAALQQQRDRVPDPERERGPQPGEAAESKRTNAPGPLHWEREGRMVRVRAGASGHAAVLALSAEPDEWTVGDVAGDEWTVENAAANVADNASGDAPGDARANALDDTRGGARGDAPVHAPETFGAALAVRLRLRLSAGESVRLTVVATTGGDDALTASLGALRPDALVHARRAAMRLLQRERLALVAPDDRFGNALAWARYRLDTYRAELPGLGRTLVAGYGVTGDRLGMAAAAGEGGPGMQGSGETRTDAHARATYDGSVAARTALAALACGDFDAAIDVIRFLGERQMPSGRIPSRVVPIGDEEGTAPDATLLYLLLVARYLAWTGDTSLVREAWGRVRQAYAWCFADRGAKDAGTDGEVLREAVRRELATTAKSTGFPLHEEAEAAAPSSEEGLVWLAGPAYVAGRSEEGFRNWQEDVFACFDGARGAWGGRVRDEAAGSASAADGGAAFADDAAMTASVVSTFVHGMLGAEPDAEKGRLRLRPQIPDVWDRLDVKHLRIGDTSIDLAYRRDGDRHIFRLDQTSGAVPVTLVFEPMIAARRLVAARIDDQPAELDPRPRGERMLVPVQIALDAPRVVELDVAHDLGPQPGGLRVWRQ